MQWSAPVTNVLKTFCTSYPLFSITAHKLTVEDHKIFRVLEKKVYFLKILFVSVIGACAYWIIGYSLAFGGGNGFAGDTMWASHNMEDSNYPHWFFHFVFAATAATIVSGAMAERCEFIAYITYSSVITGKHSHKLPCDGITYVQYKNKITHRKIKTPFMNRNIYR